MASRINIRRSLRASFHDGVFAALMAGITEHYVIPLGLFFGATVLQIGLVSALANLFSSFSQLTAVTLIYWVGGRVKLLVRLVCSQATFCLMIAFITLFEFSFRVECFLALVALIALTGGLAGPAWGSLMSDYIPASKRGRYFGWRSSMLGGVTLSSMITAGLLLYLSRQWDFRGFIWLFLMAATFRFISAGFCAQMSEPPQRKDPASDFTFYMFVSRFRESNFLKFVAFVAALNCASFMAAPFFAVYMLRDLQLSYLWYMILQVCVALASFTSFPLWGRHADHFGNVRVLRLGGFFASIIPLLWLVSSHPVYLMAVQLWGGFSWGGLTLSTGNFIYDAVTPQKRSRCIAYFNVVNGVAIFLGSALGGLMASRLPPLYGKPLLTLFLLSGICRLLAYALFARRFQEVRAAPEVSIREFFFSVVGIRPLVGPRHD